MKAVQNILNIMDLLEINDVMNITNVTAWMAMTGAGSALVYCKEEKIKLSLSKIVARSTKHKERKDKIGISEPNTFEISNCPKCNKLSRFALML